MPTERVPSAAFDTVVDAFVQRSRMTPDRAAFHVRGADRRWSAVTGSTYAERVGRLAAAFAASDIDAGTRVAIRAGTSFDWEVAQMSALYAGASVVGLDANYPDAMLAQLLGDSRAGALI